MRGRAWQCQALSDDFSGLQWAELPVREPAAAEVLLEVRSAALNFPDLLMCRGLYQHKPPLPFVPGLEGAGVVRSLGPGVQGLQPGQAVYFSGYGGAFAESVLLPAAQVRPLPAGLGMDEAAAFGVAALTAWVALVRRGALQRGETLLVHGASGGTGLAAVQLGRHLGATVIATGGSAAKLQVAAQCGAQHTLLTGGSSLRLRDEIKALTQGRGVDVVFDPVGGALFNESCHAMAWGGRLLVVGFASGQLPSVAANLALIKGFSVVGVRAGEYARRDPQRGEENRLAIEALAARGVFRPHIGARFALHELPQAFQALAQRRVAGKIVIDCSAPAAHSTVAAIDNAAP